MIFYLLCKIFANVNISDKHRTAYSYNMSQAISNDQNNFDVFISYSRKDYIDSHNTVIEGNIIQQIKELLAQNNISFWFDEDGVYSGDEFAPLLARNIKSSKIFLFISSENSNASEWTSNEIATAHAYKKKIIPFRYDNSVYNDSVIIYIARLDYIDYQSNPQKSMERLILSIKKYLNEIKAEEEKKREEEEKQRRAEISRKEKAERLSLLREKMQKFVERQFEIDEEILSIEKSITNLKRERYIIDSKLEDLKNEEYAILGYNYFKTTKKETGKNIIEKKEHDKEEIQQEQTSSKKKNEIAHFFNKHHPVTSVTLLGTSVFFLLFGCVAFFYSLMKFLDFNIYAIDDTMISLLFISYGYFIYKIYTLKKWALTGILLVTFYLGLFENDIVAFGYATIFVLVTPIFSLLFFLKKNNISTWQRLNIKEGWKEFIANTQKHNKATRIYLKCAMGLIAIITLFSYCIKGIKGATYRFDYFDIDYLTILWLTGVVISLYKILNFKKSGIILLLLTLLCTFINFLISGYTYTHEDFEGLAFTIALLTAITTMAFLLPKQSRAIFNEKIYLLSKDGVRHNILGIALTFIHIFVISYLLIFLGDFYNR